MKYRSWNSLYGQNFALGLVGSLMMAGCSFPFQYFQSKKVDYVSQGAVAPALDVPPGLDSPKQDERYQVTNPHSMVYSDYHKSLQAQDNPAPKMQNCSPDATSLSVLPAPVTSVQYLKDGSDRWLRVQGKPNQVWPVLEHFWQDQHMTLAQNDPAAGWMITDWVNDPQGVPVTVPADTTGAVAGNLPAQLVQVRMRVRIEATKDLSGTDVFLTEQGQQQERTVGTQSAQWWAVLPEDRQLEDVYLRQLALSFKVPESPSVAPAPTPEQPALVTTEVDTFHDELKTLPSGETVIEMKEPFDRAWRHVGLALDRGAFTIEDRDRSQGIYYISYTDKTLEDQEKSNKSLWSKIAFWRSEDKSRFTKTYRVTLSSNADEETKVDMRDKEDKEVPNELSKRVLTLLNDQLK